MKNESENYALMLLITIVEVMFIPIMITEGVLRVKFADGKRK